MKRKLNIFEFIRRLGLLGYIKIKANDELIKKQWKVYVEKCENEK